MVVEDGDGGGGDDAEEDGEGAGPAEAGGLYVFAERSRKVSGVVNWAREWA